MNKYSMGKKKELQEKREQADLTERILDFLEEKIPDIQHFMARTAIGVLVMDYKATDDTDRLISDIIQTFHLENDHATISDGLTECISAHVTQILDGNTSQKRRPGYELIGKLTVFTSSVLLASILTVTLAIKSGKIDKKRAVRTLIEMVDREDKMDEWQKKMTEDIVHAFLDGDGPMGAFESVLGNLWMEEDQVQAISEALTTYLRTKNIEDVVTWLPDNLDLTNADKELIISSFQELLKWGSLDKTNELLQEQITAGIDLATKPMQEDVRRIIRSKRDHATKAAMRVFLNYNYDASTFRKMIIDSVQGRSLTTSTDERFIKNPRIQSHHHTLITQELSKLSQEKKDLLFGYFGSPGRRNNHQTAQLYLSLEKMRELRPKIQKVIDGYEKSGKHSKVALQACKITLDQYVFYMGILDGVDPEVAFKQIEK